MNDLHPSAIAPRWRFLYVARFDAYEVTLLCVALSISDFEDKSTLLAACKPLILLGFARSFNDTPTRKTSALCRRFSFCCIGNPPGFTSGRVCLLSRLFPISDFATMFQFQNPHFCGLQIVGGYIFLNAAATKDVNSIHGFSSLLQIQAVIPIFGSFIWPGIARFTQPRTILGPSAFSHFIFYAKGLRNMPLCLNSATIFPDGGAEDYGILNLYRQYLLPPLSVGGFLNRQTAKRL